MPDENVHFQQAFDFTCILRCYENVWVANRRAWEASALPLSYARLPRADCHRLRRAVNTKRPRRARFGASKAGESLTTPAALRYRPAPTRRTAPTSARPVPRWRNW